MTERVCFLREKDQVLTLASQPGRLLETSRLISVDLDASAALEDLDLEYEELWDRLDLDELRALEEKAYDLTDSWYRRGEPRLPEWLVEVLPLDRVTWCGVFRDALLARKLFERVVTTEVGEICLCTPHRGGSPFASSNDVPDAVWAFQAQQTGLDLRLVPRRSSSKHSRWQRYAREMDRLLTAPRRIVEGVLHTTQSRSLGEGPILFYASPGERKRYAGICRALKKILGNRFLALTRGRRGQSGEGVFRTLESFTGRISSRSPGEELQLAELPVAEEYPYLFRNEHLFTYFDHHRKSRWPKTSSLLTHLDRFIREIQPAAVLVTDSSYYYQNAICLASRKRNVPVVAVPHSTTPGVFPLRLRADAAFAWTEAYRQTFIRDGLPDDRVFLVGVPADLLRGAYSSRVDSRRSSGDPERRTVLVLSAGTKRGLLPFTDLSTYPAMVKELVTIPEDLRDRVDVCWKCHPNNDHFEFYQVVARKAGASNVRIVRTEPLEALVNQADVVVLPTTPTSSYLAALFADKPIVFCNGGQVGTELFQPADEQGCVVIDDVSGIWPAIRRLLFEDEYRESLLARARAFREEFAGESDLQPADRIAEKMNQRLDELALSSTTR
ncbi:MAG: hypothetical protein O7H41_02075 [Planctomycetota bacterium]|nr:hypothetical protein [Planctomycetota bacterium]